MSIIDLQAHVKDKAVAKALQNGEIDMLKELIPAIQQATQQAAATGDPSQLINVMCVAICTLAEEALQARDAFHLIGIRFESEPEEEK